MQIPNKLSRSYLVFGLPLMMLVLGVVFHEWWFRTPNLLASLAISGDPSFFGKLNRDGTTPSTAVVGVAVIIAGLVLVGNVKTTWSFSAFSVLIYYAITNVSALRMNKHERLYPRLFAWLGLFSCLFLACWVDRVIWMIGLGLIAVGLTW